MDLLSISKFENKVESYGPYVIVLKYNKKDDKKNMLKYIKASLQTELYKNCEKMKDVIPFFNFNLSDTPIRNRCFEIIDYYKVDSTNLYVQFKINLLIEGNHSDKPNLLESQKQKQKQKPSITSSGAIPKGISITTSNTNNSTAEPSHEASTDAAEDSSDVRSRNKMLEHDLPEIYYKDIQKNYGNVTYFLNINDKLNQNENNFNGHKEVTIRSQIKELIKYYIRRAIQPITILDYILEFFTENVNNLKYFDYDKKKYIYVFNRKTNNKDYTLFKESEDPLVYNPDEIGTDSPGLIYSPFFIKLIDNISFQKYIRYRMYEDNPLNEELLIEPAEIKAIEKEAEATAAKKRADAAKAKAEAKAEELKAKEDAEEAEALKAEKLQRKQKRKH